MSRCRRRQKPRPPGKLIFLGEHIAGEGQMGGTISAGNILRTNHVGFTVKDLDRAITMFSDLFGYEVKSRGRRDLRGVALLTGVAGADIEVVHLFHPNLLEVELITYHKPDGAGRTEGRPCDIGYVHLTFDVRNMETMVTAAAVHGLVPIGRVVTDGKGKSVVYLRDPDGINIELICMHGSGT
jgi:catechol 2,3-dioxygenase-like lactoylglutathione lyase family enzyme